MLTRGKAKADAVASALVLAPPRALSTVVFNTNITGRGEDENESCLVSGDGAEIQAGPALTENQVASTLMGFGTLTEHHEGPQLENDDEKREASTSKDGTPTDVSYPEGILIACTLDGARVMLIPPTKSSKIQPFTTEQLIVKLQVNQLVDDAWVLEEMEENLVGDDILMQYALLAKKMILKADNLLRKTATLQLHMEHEKVGQLGKKAIQCLHSSLQDLSQTDYVFILNETDDLINKWTNMAEWHDATLIRFHQGMATYDVCKYDQAEICFRRIMEEGRLDEASTQFNETQTRLEKCKLALGKVHDFCLPARDDGTQLSMIEMLRTVNQLRKCDWNNVVSSKMEPLIDRSLRYVPNAPFILEHKIACVVKTGNWAAALDFLEELARGSCHANDSTLLGDFESDNQEVVAKAVLKNLPCIGLCKSYVGCIIKQDGKTSVAAALLRDVNGTHLSIVDSLHKEAWDVWRIENYLKIGRFSEALNQVYAHLLMCQGGDSVKSLIRECGEFAAGPFVQNLSGSGFCVTDFVDDFDSLEVARVFHGLCDIFKEKIADGRIAKSKLREEYEHRLLPLSDAFFHLNDLKVVSADPFHWEEATELEVGVFKQRAHIHGLLGYPNLAWKDNAVLLELGERECHAPDTLRKNFGLQTNLGTYRNGLRRAFEHPDFEIYRFYGAGQVPNDHNS